MKTTFNYLILWLFLAVSASCAHAAIDKKTVNVREFGAKGDGVTLDSPAFNKAIDAVAKRGGKVIIPEGKYLCGTIRLKSNIHLFLDKGAVIVADKWNSTSYDPTEPFTPPAYQDGGHSFFQNSLIRGENLENITISGEGKIDGSGLTTWQGELNKKIGFGAGSQGENAASPVSPETPTYAANKAISLKLCKNVIINGITIYKGGWFAILATGCDNMVMDGLIIDTNRDGMDIDCCKDVVVRNCKVNSPDDDAICPKSTHALGYPRLTENLLVENCEVSGFKVGTLIDGTRIPNEKNRNGRIKFGTESTGGFRNCKIENCRFYSCMGFAIEEVDGGITENISANNLKIFDARNYAIYIVTGIRNRNPLANVKSTMRNISISNVSVDGVDKLSGIQIFGLADQPIENIELKNISIVANGGGTTEDANRTPKELGTGYPDPAGKPAMPAYGIYARHVKNLKLSSIDFSYKTPDLRPAAMFSDVNGLVLDSFKAQVEAGIEPVIYKDKVAGIKVTNSPTINQQK